MSTPDVDVDLTIALAEYEHLRNMLDRLEQKSSGRFNFFLAITTAVAAVSAGLLSQNQATDLLGAIGALGLLVLFLGLTMFVRQVEFTVQDRRLKAAQDALRLYFVRRAPELKPYVLLPAGKDQGVYGMARHTPRWLRETIGLAGTISLINSALLGLGVGMVIAQSQLGTLPVVAAVILFVFSLLVHQAYLWRTRTAGWDEVDKLLEGRGLFAPPEPEEAPSVD